MAISVKQRAKVAAWVLVAAAVATSPITVSAATDSKSTTITTTVQPTISLTSGANVGLTILPDATGVISTVSNAITVSTNNSAGYTLGIKDSDATTTLADGGNSFATATSPTTAGALANGEWGWAVPSATTGVGVTGFDASYSVLNSSTTTTSKWAGVNASSGSNVNVKTTGTTATNDPTTVWFAARANTSQPTGNYTGAVTFTATTN
ncbi:MAG: hypothetical protein QG649_689 [Patescibacteria group bacterium]|jgi:hypothetical protein|nr:hypothetical protein [Patescibacteria group bacterium]